MEIVNIDTIQTAAIVIALWINAKANGLQEKAVRTNIGTLNLQRNTLQANMFSQVTERMNVLLEARPKPNELGDTITVCLWSSSFLRALSHFAFLAKHSYLSPEMIKLYQNFIVIGCDDVANISPELVKQIKSETPKSYGTLREFYEKAAVKQCPF